MKLKQFQSLCRDEQYNFVKQFATFLIARKSSGLSSLLYQFNNFYVEVLYDTRTSSVKVINSFDNTDELEPYLKLVNVTKIYDLLK